MADSTNPSMQRQAKTLRVKQEIAKELLNHNGELLQWLTDLEADLDHLPCYDTRISRPVLHLLDETLLMAQELNSLSQDRFTDLYGALDRIRAEVLPIFSKRKDTTSLPISVFLDHEKTGDSHLTGGKAAGIAALNRLFPHNVPSGFILTTAAYRRLMNAEDLEQRVRLAMKDIAYIGDTKRFHDIAESLRSLLSHHSLSKEIREAIERSAAQLDPEGTTQWAVRSSAIGEDGRFSFAGQFESVLNVPHANLAEAYLQVVSSRFTDRTMRYRLHAGFREVDTPMAVLFMPMVQAQAAGIVQTQDPLNPESDSLILHTVNGLGDVVVRGERQPDILRLERSDPHQLQDLRRAEGSRRDDDFYLDDIARSSVAVMAMRVERELGYPVEIEWALDTQGKVWLLQSRRLSPSPQGAARRKHSGGSPLAEGGVTICAGRAEGNLVRYEPGLKPEDLETGSVLLVDHPTPDHAIFLPRLAALLAIHGNPAGHIATLSREFFVPSLFQLGDSHKRLHNGTRISLNAAKRSIYAGSRWKGVRERVLVRIASSGRNRHSGALYSPIMELNLTDPTERSFKAKSCRSIHDCIRFMHEMTLHSLFRLGDEQRRQGNRGSLMLNTELPLRLHLMDLGHCLDKEKDSVDPQAVRSLPFAAWWKGVSDPRLHWSDRWTRAFAGLSEDFKEQVMGDTRGPRRSGDANYAIVGGDYLNVNTRMSYHYAMIDATVGPGSQANHVHFRFFGGGGPKQNRERRILFLERVLRQAQFGVDCQGELLTAWLRHHPQSTCEKALRLLGRLMVFSRDLDGVRLDDDALQAMAADFLTRFGEAS